jgi:PAS domain S-box-containing protein
VTFGWKSTAAIPLFKSGEVTGVLNLYLRERDAFDEETKKLLLEMAATISHGLDILESERQRIKVENKLEKLSQVVDQNPYPTVITDLDGIIQYSNPACRKISGYTEEELIGQKMSIFNSGIHSKEFYADLWDTLKKKKTVWKGTLVDRMKNGEQKDCYSTIFPLFDAEGNLAKFVSIKDDLTERNQKDKLFMMQTRQAQMGEMLAMIAHQWRQPLAIINAIVGKIRVEEAFSDQENHVLLDRLKKIEEQSIHLSQTITEFKDFFRPDKEMEQTSFSVILSHAVNLVDHSIKTHDISFVQTLHQDPTLKTYANEILQVIITLIKNSVDAFEENKIKAPKISINIDKVGTYAMLSIEDNAGGIKPEVLDKIFLPYFTTKTTSNGTGLGLYMCKMIIEEHCGGKIEGFSDNTMATFKIFLPIEETV